MAFIYEARTDAENGARAAGLVPNEVVCRDHDSGKWGWREAGRSLALVGGSSVTIEGKAEPAVEPAASVPQPGDYIVEVSGGMAAADAQALAVQLARKLGVTIIVRHVATREVAAVVNKGDTVAKGKILTPDAVQQQIIDMCMRDNGSNPWELFETVQPKSPRPWGKMVEKIAEDFGYVLTVGLTRWGKKACDSYTLRPIVVNVATPAKQAA